MAGGVSLALLLSPRPAEHSGRAPYMLPPQSPFTAHYPQPARHLLHTHTHTHTHTHHNTPHTHTHTNTHTLTSPLTTHRRAASLRSAPGLCKQQVIAAGVRWQVPPSETVPNLV